MVVKVYEMRTQLKWNYAPVVPIPYDMDAMLLVRTCHRAYYVVRRQGSNLLENFAGFALNRETVEDIEWWAELPDDLGTFASEADLGLAQQPMTARRKVQL